MYNLIMSSPLKIKHKIARSSWVTSPLGCLSTLFSITHSSPPQEPDQAVPDQSGSESAPEPASASSSTQQQASAPVSDPPFGFMMDEVRGVGVSRISDIEEVYLGRELKVSLSPWGDLLKWGDRHLDLYPSGQRIRLQRPAQEAMKKHGPSLFHDRWLTWVAQEMKDVYKSKMERAISHPKEPPQDLYHSIRLACLKVVARTVCSSFIGEVIYQIAAELETLDLSYGRLLFSGKGAKPAWFPSSDHKKANIALKNIEGLIRPLIRKRLGGVNEDDLLSRWVNTQGEDGRHLNEGQVISEALAFLMMSYTSLPKIIFGAAVKVTSANQPELLERLRRECQQVARGLTPPPQGQPLQTPIPKLKASKTLSLHHNVTLESMRLNPPAWLVSYTPIGDGEFAKMDVTEGDQIWISPWALHRNGHRFKSPHRFWPQRWAGQLEAQLPQYAFSPFGLEGKASLSETFCVELAPRFLSVWFSLFEPIDPPKQVEWVLSLCLRPAGSLDWRLKTQKKEPTAD